MKINYSDIKIADLCLWFGVSRQAFYKHKQRSSTKALEQEFVLKEVIEIRKLHKRMGGRKLFVKKSSGRDPKDSVNIRKETEVNLQVEMPHLGGLAVQNKENGSGSNLFQA